MKGVVYRLVNKQTGQSYIGRTFLRLQARLSMHMHAAKHVGTKNEGQPIVQALRKYGLEAFNVETLYESDHYENKRDLNKLLNEKEIYFIDKFDSINNGYNRTKGGGGMLGFQHSEAGKQAIKEANAKRTKSENFKDWASKRSKEMWSRDDYRNKMSKIRSGKGNSMFGVKLTGEKNHNYGRPLSEETRKKISTTMKEKKYPIGRKSILQYSLDGVFIQEWPTIRKAQLECNTCHISDCAKGKCNSSGGYIWRYKTSDDIPQKIDVPTKRNSKGLFMPE